MRPGAENETSPNRGYWLILIVATTIGLYARLTDLARESLWVDEAYGRYWVEKPFSRILTAPEAEDPLFLVMQKICLDLIGIDDLHLRMLPLLFSMLSSVFIFLAMKRLTSSAIACLATSYFLLLPLGIFWSRVARPYTFLLFTASMWFFFSIAMLKTPRRKYLIGSLLSAILTLFTQRSAVFVAPLVPLSLLFMQSYFRQDRRALWIAVTVMLAGFALYAVYALHGLEHNLRLSDHAASLTAFKNPLLFPVVSFFYHSPLTQAPPTHLIDIPIAAYLAVGFVLFLLWAVVYLWRSTARESEMRRIYLFIILWLTTPLLAMMALSYAGRPAYIPARYDLVIIVAELALLILAISRCSSGRIRVGLYCLLFALLTPYHCLVTWQDSNNFARRHDRLQAQRLSVSMGQEDSCIFVNHVYFTYRLYMQPDDLQNCYAYRTMLDPLDQPQLNLEQFLTSQIARSTKLWVVMPAIANRNEFLYSLDSFLASQTIKRVAEHKQLLYIRQVTNVPFDWQGWISLVLYRFAASEDKDH